MHAPGLQDVLAARPRVYEHLSPTPLLRHALLDDALGCQAWIKHENHNPTGSFKVRGGVNLVGQLDAHERRAGVIAASTGNHGQSIAFASRVHGVPCRIVVPVGANPEKMAAIRAMGAEVTEFGRDFDEAREHVEDLAPRNGWRYVHSANEPHLIAGVGTYALEIFDAVPDVDYLFVPIGGGSGAAGCGLVRTARGSRATLIGVQAAGADAFAQSWRGPVRVTRDRIDTFAEGLATRTTFDLTFAMLREHLDDVVTLDEPALREGVRAALGLTHNLAEGAGAASIAAAYQYRARIADTKVVCVMSGGNIDAATLKAVLS
jgi:threonine dehydratase